MRSDIRRTLGYLIRRPAGCPGVARPRRSTDDARYAHVVDMAKKNPVLFIPVTWVRTTTLSAGTVANWDWWACRKPDRDLQNRLPLTTRVLPRWWRRWWRHITRCAFTCSARHGAMRVQIAITTSWFAGARRRSARQQDCEIGYRSLVVAWASRRTSWSGPKPSSRRDCISEPPCIDHHARGETPVCRVMKFWQATHGVVGAGRQDLRRAEILLAVTPPDVEGALFHSQQAARSAKGFPDMHDIAFRQVHELGEIGKQCLQADPTLSDLLQRANSLTKYAVDFAILARVRARS